MILELDGHGLQFSNCGLDGFPPYVAMLAIDNVLYFLLAIYFDNVIPGRQNPMFPLSVDN